MCVCVCVYIYITTHIASELLQSKEQATPSRPPRRRHKRRLSKVKAAVIASTPPAPAAEVSCTPRPDLLPELLSGCLYWQEPLLEAMATIQLDKLPDLGPQIQPATFEIYCGGLAPEPVLHKDLCICLVLMLKHIVLFFYRLGFCYATGHGLPRPVSCILRWPRRMS